MAQFKPHKHAQKMGKYAGDARQTTEPWKRWQVKLGEHWVDLDTHPHWDENAEYRRKDVPFKSEAWAAHNATINAKKPPLGKGPKPVIGSLYSPISYPTRPATPMPTPSRPRWYVPFGIGAAMAVLAILVL